MPSRNYRQEYDRYQGSSKQKLRRAKRNRVRRDALRKGRVRLGDSKDIDHKDGNPNNNSSSNLRVQSRSTNRSFKRNSKAQKA